MLGIFLWRERSCQSAARQSSAIAAAHGQRKRAGPFRNTAADQNELALPFSSRAQILIDGSRADSTLPTNILSLSNVEA